MTTSARETLDEAKAAPKARHRRRLLRTLGPALTMILTVVVLWAVVLTALKIDASSFKEYFGIVADWSAVVILLTLIPQDRKVVWAVAFFFVAAICAVVSASVAILAGYASQQAWSRDVCVAYPGLGPTPCWHAGYWMGVWAGNLLMETTIGCAALHALVCHARRPYSYLRHIWTVACCLSVERAAFNLLKALGLWLQPGTSDHTRFIVSLVCHAASDVVLASLCLASERRARLQSWLSSLGADERLSSAAAVASLIAGRSVDEVLQLARQEFQAVCMGKVSEQAMSNNVPDPALRALTEPARLGHVDAFLSHSWSDPPQDKWAAMQQWRTSFVQRHGREPQVWLDKFCIDQGNIADSLAALPVYLSGCRELVLLYGPTYSSRLWCVVELFVFVQMKSALSDVVVLPFAHEPDYASFDAGTATCYLQDDKDRLLAFIEAGFSAIEEFNDAVRELLSRARSFSRGVS